MHLIFGSGLLQPMSLYTVSKEKSSRVYLMLCYIACVWMVCVCFCVRGVCVCAVYAEVHHKLG